MHYDYSSPEAVPAFDPCPRVCIWSHRADRGSIPPRWGDDPGSRAGPARGFAAVRGVGRLCLSGRLRTAQEASKRGMGAEPPCKPRPCSQEAACSRLMAVTQRRRPPRLADLPHDQRQRPGGEAPSSTAPHDDRRPDRRGPRKYRPHASHAPGTSRGEHRKRKNSHAKALACAPKSRRAWVVGCGVRLEYSPTGRQTKRRKSVRVGSFPAFPDAIGAASMAST